MDFKIKKPVYYVGVQTRKDKDYHLTFITDIDNSNRTWEANPNKKPLKFSKALAEEMVICLEINGVCACVVYYTGEISGQPYVDHTPKEERKVEYVADLPDEVEWQFDDYGKQIFNNKYYEIGDIVDEQDESITR